jgi:hypothetical protein
VTLFSGALALFAALDLWRKKMPPLKLAALAGLALLIVWMAFLAMINFHLKEFWANYLFAAGGRTGKPLWALHYYLFHIQGITWLPLILLWLLSLPWLPGLRDRELGQLAVLISIPVFLLAFMGALNHGVIWYVIFILFIVVSAWSKQLPRPRAVLLQLVFAAALLAANCRYGLAVVGLLNGEIKTGPSQNLAQARALESTPGRTVLIDAETARYVFDYHIPPGACDWNFSTPFPGSMGIESAPHPGDLYLLGPTVVRILNQGTSLNEPLPQWKPFGSDRWACFKYPKSAFIINPQDCVGLPGVGQRKVAEQQN